MIKYVFLGVATIFLVACAPKDEHYYRLHPRELEKVLKNCPAQHPAGIACDQLQSLALEVNQLAYTLQMNPQLFGKKIIELQEKLAKKQADFAKNPQNAELKAAIISIQDQLANRIAIVNWLESPENSS